MRLGVVLTQARVLLRLRGREERDYHEEHAIQHGEPRASCSRQLRRGRESTEQALYNTLYVDVARTRSHTAEDSCERQLTINPFTNTVFRGWPARATPGRPHGNARP